MSNLCCLSSPIVAIFAVLFWTDFQFVDCHVSLSFPPARKYPLDFLDNIRSGRPCGGMAKNSSRSTVLKAGQTYEIQWILRYPHQGGFQLELLDSRDRRIKYLTPREEFHGADDVHAQSYTIQLNPDTTCKNCAIRFIRQALEWGRNYIFQSCADVDIVSQTEFSEACGERGSKDTDGRCICENGYVGHDCELIEDNTSSDFYCRTDSDCNLNGECISVDHIVDIRECFCRPGFFGQSCQKPSNLTRRSQFVDQLFRYQKYSSQRGVDFYYRPVNNGYEVEGVIVGETDSWLAVGWRPHDESGDCRLFPIVARPPTGKLHPMDCMDMIVGRVSDQGYQIGDFYTRDRSTPLPDAYYDGQDDLTSALGWEEDGKTFIMFRRPAGRNGNSDNAFDGQLTLIWAFGQGNPLTFFRDDEMKYHGGNRGSSEIVAIGYNSAILIRRPQLISVLLVLTTAIIGK